MPVQETDRTRTLKNLFLESDIQDATAESVAMIPVDSIVPNRNQPRKSIDAESLKELAETIRAVGIIQPIVVVPLDASAMIALEGPKGPQYELVAGERRWRACQLLGLKVIPALRKTSIGDKSRAMALIENLARTDLSVLETANGLIDLMGETGIKKVEDVAAMVGLKRRSAFLYARIGRTSAQSKEIIAQHELDLTGADFFIGLVEKGEALKDPKKKESFGKEIFNPPQRLDKPFLQDLHEKYFGESGSGRDSKKGKKSPKNKASAMIALEPFWDNNKEIGLHLEAAKPLNLTNKELAVFGKAIGRFLKGLGSHGEAILKELKG